MSEAPNVIIRPEHQSAPKDHPAEKEIAKAAEEIGEGRWIDEPTPEAVLDDLGLALRTGELDELRGTKPSLEDFRQTRELNELARHPRVVEALARLQREVEEAKNPQEAMERAWMLWEMQRDRAHGKMSQEKQDAVEMGLAAPEHDQRWGEQKKLATEKEEESRHGLLLTPVQFYERLAKVTGKGRIKLSMNVVKTDPLARSGRVGLYVHNPLWKGQQIKNEYPQVKARELREEAQRTITAAKKLRKLQLHSEADRKFDQAGEMIKEATTMLMEMSAAAQLAEPEFLRVATLQWPLGTEWMVVNFNEFGVPTTAKYLGWRTALLTMIRCGAITEKEARKAFPVGSGEAASWYLEQLMMMRNVAGSVQ